ncbi:MAG: hypothetical protein ACR2N7_01495 [Acidimicrobiia bacterium]
MKVGLRWPLIVSGLVLIAAGLVSLVMVTNNRGGAHRHGHPGIGALPVVFVVALALAPPPPGAAAAADRVPNRVAIAEAPDSIELQATQAADERIAESSDPLPNPVATDPNVAVSEPDDSLGEQPEVATDPNASQYEPDNSLGEQPEVATDPNVTEYEPDNSLSEQPEVGSALDTGAAPLTATEEGAVGYTISLYDLIAYSLSEPDEIIGVPLQLVGFSAPEPDLAGGFRLTRYLMGCCAADAFPLQVTLVDPPFIPDVDEWVIAEAIWDGELTDINEYGEGVPVLKVLKLTPIDPPPDPYES